MGQSIISLELAYANHKRKAADMIPLVFGNVNEDLVIKKVGGSPELRGHLEDMGFVVGSVISIVNRMGENVIVNVKDTRIAISREMAQKIMV